MESRFKDLILQSTGARSLAEVDMVQSLWSGYGKILRYQLEDSLDRHVIVKHIRIPQTPQHPRGWDSPLGHERKIASYLVEVEWYRNWNQTCKQDCRTARCFAIDANSNEIFIVLEDLRDAGLRTCAMPIDITHAKACIRWLAHFHALFMHAPPGNLWQQGTYWHLDTRPDEWHALAPSKLKDTARAIDTRLRTINFPTLVHGDAKLANFCISADTSQVAAVDFQYVGGGCGMQDLAYFLNSSLSEQQCEQWLPSLLDFYFAEFKSALTLYAKHIDARQVEQEWRDLFPLAWVDFYRFLMGWCPDHWKNNPYSQAIVNQTLSDFPTP